MDTVFEFLKKAGTYYLATMEGDQPRVRPFGTVNIYDGKLYIQTGKVKQVSAQIAANPKVELCAFHKGTWIRLSGTLKEDGRMEAQQSMLEAYPGLASMYQPGDGNTQVLYFQSGRAVISSFSQPEKVIEF